MGGKKKGQHSNKLPGMNSFTFSVNSAECNKMEAMKTLGVKRSTLAVSVYLRAPFLSFLAAALRSSSLFFFSFFLPCQFMRCLCFLGYLCSSLKPDPDSKLDCKSWRVFEVLSLEQSRAGSCIFFASECWRTNQRGLDACGSCGEGFSFRQPLFNKHFHFFCGGGGAMGWLGYSVHEHKKSRGAEA